MKIVVRDQPQVYKATGLEEQFLPTATPDLSDREYPREALADILGSYNNDAKALEQIEALRQGRHCVVTGQQLGVMGGPAYTILKGISCLLAARAMNAVPVFWLATEDHDVAEVDHTYLVDPVGNLDKFHLPLPKDGRFVEDLVLDEHCQKLLQAFLRRVGITDPLPKATSYTQVMVYYLTQIFAGTGMVFLEPKLLRPLARDFFRREIVDRKEIKETLQATTKALVAAGGTPSLPIDKKTNLFYKSDRGHRRRVLEDGGPSEEMFLEMIDNQPERLSTDVASRPVLQSLLIPALAYVAGPSEIAYFHQLKDYHSFHGVPMPQIIPRLSATFITPYAADFLSKCNLNPWETIPQHWHEVIPELGQGLKEVDAEWQQSTQAHLKGDFSSIVRHSVDKLQRRLYKRRLSHLKTPYYALHYLHNFLRPHEEPQERLLNWWEFQMHTDENIVQSLLDQADWQERGHHYCYL